MNIVIEGVDGSGKSTLAKFLSEEFDMPIQSSEGPGKSEKEINDRAKRYLAMRNTIFDRHPCISQNIYALMRDGPLVDQIWLDALYSSNTIFIACYSDDEKLGTHEVKSYDTKEHLTQIDQNYDYLSATYQQWAFAMANIIYKRGTSMRFVLDQVRQRINFQADIKDFLSKFGQDYWGQPRFLPDEFRNLREERLQEEVDEYLKAETLEDKFDALIDVAIIAIGNARLHGFDFNAGWALVHSANMKKERAIKAEDSKYGSTFDIVKPAGWKPPQLKKAM